MLLCFVSILIFSTKLSAQSIPYEGPTDEAGDPGAMRLGLMNGNRVSLQISNKVSFGGWPSPLVSLWPNDATGLNIFDSFNLIVGDMVFIQKCSTCPFDSTPVLNDVDIQTLSSQGQLDTLWYAQSSSIQPNFMDLDPTGTIEYGFYPVFGYFNRLNEYPAMSNIPDSWPPDGWPSTGQQTFYKGEWNGRFGRGVKYADLESYWVCNDAQDLENLQPSSPLHPNGSLVRFYPRPSVKIGDLHPNDITVQKGLPWGGLGLRTEVRAYQWNNQEARDAVFFEYNITNISDYDLTRAVFGFYLDAANGNKSPTSAAEDQVGFFDTYQDFMYTWSLSGTGFGGGKPAVSGWAFLESPGDAHNGIDDNDNGVVDERRDNTAEESWNGLPQKITGQDNVRTAFIASHDTTKFFAYYGYKSIDQVPAVQQGVWWPADEDGDWKDGNDANGNGKYDVGEDAGDDVGLDGVGPSDLNYQGPDADGTECNHKPDFNRSTGKAEPDFASTDVGESDMLGLTSFCMFPHPQQSGAAQLKNDKNVYDTIATHRLLPFPGKPANLYAAFGTGTFRLDQGRFEHLSMANVNAYDDLTGLNTAPSHYGPSIYAKLKVVVSIYRNDYRFSQPPLTPTLTAKADDGKVYLYWDDRSDKLTHEPFLGGVNDFEGYKLYRATDKNFQDAEVLRDGYGDPAGKKPIFQCDLVDSISGFATYAGWNGLEYYLGNNSGITHSYIDQDVQNGRTYYYGLAAYDYGMKGVGTLGVSIPPAESNLTVDVDEYGNIRNLGINVQVATPHQRAAGYTNPKTSFIDPAHVLDNGTIEMNIYNSDAIKSNHVYKIKFQTDTPAYARTLAYRSGRDGLITTVGYSIFDTTLNNKLLYQETQTNNLQANWVMITDTVGTTQVKRFRPNSLGITSNVVDGMQFVIKQTSDIPSFDSVRSGWQIGNAPVEVKVNRSGSPYFAYDYDIVFVDTTLEPSYKTIITKKLSPPIYDLNNKPVTIAKAILLGQSFPFHVINRDFQDTTASGYKGYEQLDVVVLDVNLNGKYDPDTDYVMITYVVNSLGQPASSQTILGLRFKDKNNLPHPGDVYQIKFNKALQDSIMFTVNTDNSTDVSTIDNDMKQIKVVPNPYIVTNTMEPYISNQNFNQQRVLLFTHIPAQSTIKIFTSSGVFIRQIDVDNAPDNGSYKWNMLTKEGLEIAAGIYVYDVKSKVTGKEKLGKFAVIK